MSLLTVKNGFKFYKSICVLKVLMRNILLVGKKIYIEIDLYCIIKNIIIYY